MENLSRIAQGIFLGNGEVWNFLDYAVNRNCGGLLTYTRAEYEPKGKKNYLISNISQNFNKGSVPRYKYNDITTSETYAIDRIWGGFRGAPRGVGSDIGDLYKVPDDFNTSNSDINFITKDEYTEFQKAIRQKNISKRDDEAILVINTAKQPYKEISTESYAGQFEDKWKKVGLKEVGLGDEINLWGEDDVKHSKYSLEEFASSAWLKQELINIDIQDKKGVFIHNEDTYRYFSVDHPIHYHNITAKVSERTFERLKKIEEVAKEKQDTVRHYQSASQRFVELASKNVVLRDNVTFNGLLFEYTTEGTEIPSIPAIENYGLYGYYNNERLTNKERLIFWKPNKSYGIDYSQKSEEYYSINEENKFKGEVSISSEFNGESHSVYNITEGTRSYSFYNESEKGATPKLLSTSVSDGSSVSLTDYSNASRLLRKTNQLFRDAKIGSLINRFHTNGIGEGGEFITAYNESYGMSRGRNLLRENGVDTSSGYEDPYCRVWTAHHQYSKLKDRIRPFVDDNGDPKSLAEMQSNYGKLRPEDGANRLSDYSVLRTDGFVNITPRNVNGELFEDLKNYMFSIENLAWKDVTKNEDSTALSKEQRGPNGGRIMWFPPYNLKFSENVNVNWNANNFIGRGEEIYTYTNTVRSGTLDFTLLIDHPSILNKWRGQIGNVDGEEKKKREEDLLRFFAGCGNLNDVVTSENPPKEKGKSPEEIDNRETQPVTDTKNIAYVIFFPNDFSAQNYMDGAITIDEGEDSEKTISKVKYACEYILQGYNSGDAFDERDKSFQNEVLQPHNLISSGFNASESIETIRETLFNGDKNIEIKTINDLIDIKSNFTGDKIYGHSSTTCKIQKVTVKGFASSHGIPKNNEILRNRRRLFIQKAMEEYCQELSVTNVKYVPEEGNTVDVKDIDGRGDVNTLKAKLARAAYAIVSIEWKEENVAHEPPVNNNVISVYGAQIDKMLKNYEEPKTIQTNMSTSVTYLPDEYTYDNEYLYFSHIRGDQMVYKNIVDKVKYFDPAFHSVTPEGFNARLTFLHQCTRQGPTNAISSGRVKGSSRDEEGNIIDNGSDDYLKFAGNLSFGRAPYCILRIGDFFNTKICIDSMSINYDNNGGVQWDLNPEGVGVQPMYANISISFKFLGGQDISRPIERLQNAVTANYYANTSVYSRHADNNKFYYDAMEDRTGLYDK